MIMSQGSAMNIKKLQIFLLLLIFFLSCFGIRMVLANYISKVFLKFGIKQKIAIVAIRDSSGTLGTAVSAGFMMVIIQNFENL